MNSILKFCQNNSMNQEAFLALVRAGLWEKDVQLSQFGEVDYMKVMRLAEEQSVVGLVTAGLERVKDVRVPQEILLQFIGQILQIEQKNQAMNEFVAQLIEKLRKKDIYAILVKGQGVAQCYEKPSWRTSGDIDLLLSDNNYNAAKEVLTSIADDVAEEINATKHQAFVINGFDVELHGRMPFGMSRRVDKVIDEAQSDVFYCGNVRSWMNGSTTVFLPSPDNDVIFVFTHFLHHFFIEGVGLRQICDWCRLLYTYRDTLNYGLLESRIRKMGLMSEWKAFYNLASRYLGMPDLDSRLMIQDSRFDKKADRIMGLVLESGNFGHNKDLSYRSRFSGLTYKIVAVWRRFLDFCRFAAIFPLDAPLFFVTYVMGKVK